VNKKILVVAPHADDETLGCAGTLLKHKSIGDKIFWLVATTIDGSDKFSKDKVRNRSELIKTVSSFYDFDYTYSLNFKSAQLDEYTDSQLIEKFSHIINEVKPEIIYSPYPGDIHTDHRAVFSTIHACTKSFRYPYVKEVYCYETLSETNFSINPLHNTFRPNFYVDISRFLKRKLEIIDLYNEEMGEFPFPRNKRLVKAISDLRGSEAGVMAAEAFIQLKRIDK
jgi:N-acetylglucosamine malate deacetylase 1